MAFLKFPSEQPPGGWRYFQPETQLWFYGMDQGVIDMAERVAKHRVFKGLERANADEALKDIHRQLCERLGPIYCQAETNENWRPIKQDYSQNLDGEQAISFSKAFLEFAKGGGEMVSIEEGSRRASICRTCHLNMQGSGCMSCSALAAAINLVMPSNRKFEGIHLCAACGCGLQAKVNMPDNVVIKSNEERGLVYPAWCWQQTLNPS